MEQKKKKDRDISASCFSKISDEMPPVGSPPTEV